MATKARHRKTPMQLWIADQRKAHNEQPADLAALTGVTEATARGWESRGRPSVDAVDILVRHWGVPAPDGELPAGDQANLIAALRDQTAAISGLVVKLDGLAKAVAVILAKRIQEEASSRTASNAGSR